MRCEMCLQVIEDKDIEIVIEKDPQGILYIKCKCGNIDKLNIKNIPKQKAIGFEGKSVYGK